MTHTKSPKPPRMFKWDAVDTSPDFGGQNVLETFDIKEKADDMNGIREFSVAGFIFTYVHKCIWLS